MDIQHLAKVAEKQFKALSSTCDLGNLPKANIAQQLLVSVLSQIRECEDLRADLIYYECLSRRLIDNLIQTRLEGPLPKDGPSKGGYMIWGKMVGDERLELPTSSV